MSALARWPALVLTAGLATRLRPLSELRAKAAMPVAGTPIIARILRWLHAAGVRRVVLNLHHKPETITAIVGDGTEFGVNIRYSWEPVVLGSAGGPRRALPLLDADRFLIVNGDTLTDCDLAGLVEHHVRARARVTMSVVEGDVQRYGGVLVDADRRVCGFGRVREGARALHFIGVQAVDAGVFARIPDSEPAETVKTLYPSLLAADPGSIAAHESDAEFLDVGTARDYLDTVAVVAAREKRGFDIGAGCEIGEGAQIERSVLWDRVSVGRGACLVNCIVADDVVVAAGARHEDEVLVGGRSVYSVAL
jgi:NDP-sugar pyrophosphorylase family protein